jgi:hypothetical protein
MQKIPFKKQFNSVPFYDTAGAARMLTEKKPRTNGLYSGETRSRAFTALKSSRKMLKIQILTGPVPYSCQRQQWQLRE